MITTQLKRLSFLLVLFCISAISKANTDRNVLYIYINSNNQVFVEQELVDIRNLKDIVKAFIANPTDENIYAERMEREITLLGKIMVSKGVISIQCERNTTYQDYINVQNEIEKAFNELRNELALKIFKKHFKKLDVTKKEAIKKAIPKPITEADPLYVRNKNGELVPSPVYSYYFQI